jgi:hypothetical protein
MRKELGSHSLRFTYAVDFGNAALDRGMPPVEVLTQLSDRLGHGPSRVKMILEVYCWQIRHRFPEKMQLPSDFVPLEKTTKRNRSMPAMASAGDRAQLGNGAEHRRRRSARGRRAQTNHARFQRERNFQ